MTSQLRIFLSSPGDVGATREIAALTIERLAQDYARHVRIEPYLWEYEAMVASGHFQDSIEPPSAFDIVVLIVWSRLGTPLPVRTQVREYRGLDGRAPVTGTEWEFEEALASAQARGTPDLLVYRSRADARISSRDAESRRQDIEQLEQLDRFWARHFAKSESFLGAYTEFASGAEFAGAFEKHLRKLIEKRIAAQPAEGLDTAARVWTQAPFRGLEAYEFEHAPIFFGQDDALAKAMVQLVASAESGLPFLLLLGASGSGKSSLVKAGIVPRLFVPRRIPGIAFLRRVVFRPSDAREGEDLFDALARRLATRISEDEGVPELIGPGQAVADLARHLRNASAGAAYPIATALGQLTLGAREAGRMLEYETARLVLVLDQLEELFTNELLTPEERRHFIALVAGLVRSGQVWVIGTMRKDFWHQADDTPELVHLAEGNGRLELLPPSQTQLSQMIRRPAAAAGIAFERHATTDVPLSDVIAEEVTHEPGALPLLSYLLDQLYRLDVLEANGTTLRFATYERLGRLGGAIANRAEAVLQQCTPEDHPALGSVLFALIQMGTTEGDIDRAISRRAPLSAFPPGSAQRRLVDALLHPDARLLVSDAEAGGYPTVRVAHEALIVRWERARDFVEGNAEALRIRRRIEERCALCRKLEESRDGVSGHRAAGASVRGWIAGWRARRGRVPGLLADIDLADGQRLLRDHRADTEPHLVDYIERSVADERRVRSRGVRVLSVVVGVVALLALLASGAGVIALRKQQEAEAQAQQARDAQLRMLTVTAAGRLQDADTAGAMGIILEVLASLNSSAARTAEAIDVFQEARAADTGLALLVGHSDAVVGAAFSPDGQHVVTASLDNTARIWDAGSGVQLGVFAGHDSYVSSASFSPDGQRILTTSGDHSARLWNAASGALLTVLTGHTDKLRAGAWSADGGRIVTASIDRSARVWDAASGTPLAVLSGHEDGLIDVTFSPDGQRVVTASRDGTARLWDAASGRQVALFSGHLGTVNRAAFSPDGQRIVTASHDKTARIWDAANAGLLAVLAGHTDFVWSAVFSPDGRHILSASMDGTVRIWDAATAGQLMVLRGGADSVPAAAFSPDGGRIVTTSMDGTARIWGASTVAQFTMPESDGTFIESVEFSPDGGRIVIAYSDAARIRDAASGEELTMLAGHEDEVLDAGFSSDGARVITASGDRTARIWDAGSGAQLLALSGHEDRVRTAAFSPDGQRAVTASNDQSARLWDAITGKQLTLLAHDGLVREAMFSPDGQRIVTAADDHTVRLWDAATARQLATLPGHEDLVFSVAFSPDGKSILTASRDRTVKVWDVASGEQRLTLTGHDHLIWHAAWSPDGKRILTASDDRTARIWDALSGTQLAVFSGHGHYVRAAAWSPDGRRVATSAIDEAPRISEVGALPDLDTQIAWVEAAQWEVLADDERLRLGLPVDKRLRSGPEVAAPEEFARLGADHEAAAVAASTAAEKRALLLQAFSAYAAAAELAQTEGLPDDAWKAWRYRRATLARLLAREGMMAQVAEAFIAVRDDG